MQITNNNQILSYEERVNFVRLSRSKGVGPITFFKLIDEMESYSELIELSEEFFKEGDPKNPLKIASKESAIKEMDDVERFGAQMILITDDEYPQLLRHIPDPPPIITVKGDLSLLNRDIIGVVGSRNASFHGADYAKYITGDISKSGVVIASGLAKGIDGLVHWASLENGTIAAIAGGIDNIYPYQNKDLFAKIFEKGLIISEFPFGSSPKASNFIQRNRIISGISYGIIVIEATERSGSLTTARFANEQGREVFAVPGFPSDSRSRGCNRLIDQGAIFTISAEHVIDEMPRLRDSFRGDFAEIVKEVKEIKAEKSFEDQIVVVDRSGLKGMAGRIYAKLGSVEISVDEIYELFENKVQDVNIALSELELEEKIEVKNGKVLKL